MTKLHPKIQALRLKSKPYNYGPGIGHISKDVLAELETRVAKRKKDDGTTSAYFCLWGVRNDHGEGWLQGSFVKSVQERGPQSAAKQKIAVVYYHDLSDIIGKPVEISEDELGAWVTFQWADEEKVPSAKRAKYLIDEGFMNGWSFGFDHIWDKGTYDSDTDTIWWKEGELFEISPVTFGADQGTFTIRSAKDFETAKFTLEAETESVLTGLPRNKQLEIRQLLTKYITLHENEPSKIEKQLKTLKTRKSKLNLIDVLHKQLITNK